MIAIIDYDAGNLKSVEKALQSIGEDTIVSRDREEILRADKVILPGVGSFGDAMQKLRDYKLDEVIKEVTESGKPFLGICLGLQLLFERSEETPGVEGLGILKGEILRIPDHEGLKIPHMGWNSLELINIFACQFHPEKSSDVGLQILRNFAAIGKEENGYVYEKNHSMSGCS